MRGGASVSTYSSPELKLRTLALMDTALQADLGGTDPATFRWYDIQQVQNKIGTLVANGACVRVRRISTLREANQSGIMNISRPRLQIDVLDLDSERARVVANDVIVFLTKIDLCSNTQFQSPFTSPRQNPVILLSQTADMIANPQSPAGPVYVQRLDIRLANNESLSIN